MSVKRLLFRLLVIVRRFVVSLGLGVTILAVLLTVGYIFSGGWVASRLSQIVNQRLFIDRSTRLVVARVTGSLFTRVVFDGVELIAGSATPGHPRCGPIGWRPVTTWSGSCADGANWPTWR